MGVLLTALLLGVLAIVRNATKHLPIVDYNARAYERYDAGIDPAWKMVGGDARQLWVDFDRLKKQLDEMFTAPNSSTGHPGRYPPRFDEAYPKIVEEPALERCSVGDLLDYLDLADRHGQLDRFDAIASCATTRPLYQLGKLLLGSFDTLPMFGSARSMVRMSAFRVYWMLRAGELDEACRSMEHMRASIRHVESNPTLINHLVGIAIRAVMVNGLREAYQANRDMSPEAAEMLLEQLQMTQPLPVFRTGLAFERDQLLELWQAAYTGKPVDMGGSMELLDIATWKMKLLGSHKSAADAVNNLFDTVERWSALPPAEAEQQRSVIDDAINIAPSWMQQMFGITIPAYARAARNRTLIECEWNGTIIMAAVEVHRARYGAPPASLGDLVPEILHRLPADPFAPDGFYRFERLGSSGEYLLYSVGYDQTDDGGNPAEHRAIDALSGKCPESDFLIHDGRGEARAFDSLN
jgi:hypothetical protein